MLIVHLPYSLVGECEFRVSDEGCASISTNWHIPCGQGCGKVVCECDTGDNSHRGGEPYDFDEENNRIALNAAIDGMESVLLAMASRGVDMTDDRIAKAIRDAKDAIVHNYYY